MNAEELALHLGGRRMGEQFMAPCPAHNDCNPSLAIKDGENGKPVVHCHAGCTQEAVLRALRSDGIELDGDAATEAMRLWRKGKLAPARFPYLDRHGVQPGPLRIHARELLAKYENEHGSVIGVERISENGDKRFTGIHKSAAFLAQKTWDGDGLVLVEGVADALAVHQKLGMCAAASGGTSAMERAASMLKRRFPHSRIVLVPDGDDAGRRAGYAAAKALRLPLAMLPRGTDPCDLVREGRAPTLLEAIEKAAIPPGDGPRVIRADEVEPARVDWLWPRWLARGELALLAGPPGTGKTTLAIKLAACVTRGGGFPDGTTCGPGDVVFVTGEDSIVHTIQPRLIAADADLSRVHLVEGAHGVDAIEEALVQLESEGRDVHLLVIDPLALAMARGVDSHKYMEMRHSLLPLVELARMRHVAVLGITHLSKGSAPNAHVPRGPVERVIGSIAVAAAARVVWMTGADPGGGGRLVLVKSNLGPTGVGYVFDVCERRHREVAAAAIEWGEVLEGDPAALLGVPDRRPSALNKATRFLEDYLSDGPRSAKDVKGAAEEEGISEPTLQRAKRELGVRSTRKRFGQQGEWLWKLP